MPTPAEHELHYPNGVLRNNFGISDADELKRVERLFTATRAIEIERGDVALPAVFDADRLQAIHHHLLQDVYEWAGQFRDHDTGKGTTLFVVAEEIPQTAATIFTNLRVADYLQDLDREQFAISLAHLYADLNNLHPFPEGNGRTQRQFVADLASSAGHRISWSQNTQWQTEVAIAAARGDREPIIEYFRAAVEPVTDPVSRWVNGVENIQSGLTAEDRWPELSETLDRLDAQGVDVLHVAAQSVAAKPLPKDQAAAALRQRLIRQYPNVAKQTSTPQQDAQMRNNKTDVPRDRSAGPQR